MKAEVMRLVREREAPAVKCPRCGTNDAFAEHVAPRPPRRRTDDDGPDVQSAPNKREPLERRALKRCRHCGVHRDRKVRAA